MKGIIGFLLAGGIIGLIVLIVVAIIAWYVTNMYCVLCKILGPILDKITSGWGGLAWWIQFFIILIILRKVLPIGK